jgi:hypothetical protein
LTQAVSRGTTQRKTAAQQLVSTQLLELVLVQALPKQAWTGSGGTTVSPAAKVLQQLQQTILARGISAGLPVTSDSFSRATAQLLSGYGERII